MQVLLKFMHEEEVKVYLILQSIGTRVDMFGKDEDSLFMVQKDLSIFCK